MVDEVVRLHVSRDRCDVNVVFTMKNLGDQPEVMDVGFPHHYKGELMDFNARVGDSYVDVKDAAESYSLDERRHRTMYWKLWPMKFEPGANVVIEVNYSTAVKGPQIGTITQRAPNEIPHCLSSFLPREEHQALSERFAACHVRYILKTGNRWAGPIGRCRIYNV